ncbi:beta-galactosidase [Paenibacillus sp. IB182496]|uniref:Beta-galactosidase n=2 Tax=Paenibacillus sabuli TaxID=2772509 RepID=A0A927BQF2_9BACL|nr:beta-galactosidase [Paenibacillus sabuli]
MAIGELPAARVAASAEIPLLAGREALLGDAADTHGLVLHVTHAADQPHELGSAGPMDARLYPLLTSVLPSGRAAAAPVVLLEYAKGAFAGGRWVMINRTLSSAFWAGGGAALLGELAAFAAAGVTELWLKPGYACYEPGERPTLTLQHERLGRAGAAAAAAAAADGNAVRWEGRLRVYREAALRAAALPSDSTDGAAADGDAAGGPAAAGAAGSTSAEEEGKAADNSEAASAAGRAREEIHAEPLRFAAGRGLGFERLTLPLAAEPGFYTVEAELTSERGERRVLRQGFWGRDEALLQAGAPLRAGRDYFTRAGRPVPIVGMTYMTSDVARKFLHLPNAALWERDMATMAGAGINLLRTGIWTAIRTMSLADGHVSEEILRAIDAFFLCAKRHGLEVTFNFFAFTPERWEGANPYLDPRSVEAQKRFIAAVVARHRASTHVHWDLINEPSMFDPDNLWSPHPVRDPYEIAAYRSWLRERHGDIETLQERWNMTPEQLPSFDAALPPLREEMGMNTTEMTPRRGGQWLDFVLFSMDMHNRWARELREAIRQIQPEQLVTVGQDEGLRSLRPSPLFYEEAVDYTTVHSWWQMDGLVWDGIFTKAPHKPNLIQETGIMYVETPDGRAKRSEAELRNILERKYAYAFSTGGAGAVQWLWNINYYMDNVNESNIGAVRADGTQKPEADVSYDFGAFIGQAAHLFAERQLEEVAVVYPFSNDFSNRRLADEATLRLTRTLAHRMNVPFRALGEYQLGALAEQAAPRLVIVPSAHNFSDEALARLTAHVEQHGGVLLLTGPLSLDAYWRPGGRAAELVGPSRIVNVRREEALALDGRLLPVSFGGAGIAKLNKELLPDADGVYADGPATLHERPLGAGRLIWCPLPLELGETYEPLEEVYRHALAAAGVAPELEWRAGGELPGVYGRKVAFGEGVLYVFVSEYGAPCTVEVRDPASGRGYRFELEAERSVLFATDAAGELIAIYRPDEVRVEVV